MATEFELNNLCVQSQNGYRTKSDRQKDLDNDRFKKDLKML